MVTRRVSRGTPRPVEALPWGSMSTISTRLPMAARAVPRLMAVVVLPTPPFWLDTARTRAGSLLVLGAGTSNTPDCHDAAARVALRRGQFSVEMPGFPRLNQLGFGLLPLQEQALCTPLEVGLCITQQSLHRGDGTGGDDIAFDRLLLRPTVDHGRRQIHDIDDLLQEPTPFSEPID